MRIVESLQSEKAALDAQLCVVTADRDGLASECTRLRAANMEKDAQLALLLMGPSTPQNVVEEGIQAGCGAAPKSPPMHCDR